MDFLIGEGAVRLPYLYVIVLYFVLYEIFYHPYTKYKESVDIEIGQTLIFGTMNHIPF